MFNPDVCRQLTTCVLVMFAAYVVVSKEIVPDEQDLMRKIFNDQTYDNSVRPVFNSSHNVPITFGFTLIQIMDMDEKNQVLITNAWLEMSWHDERVHWQKEDYNGLEVIRIPAKMLWLPDIVLYNNADDYTSGFMPINAMVHLDGTIFWSPPARLRSSCKVDITYFPFDSQVCKLKFGSWMYDKAQVDMLNKTSEVEVGAYVTNGEWMLTSYQIVRNEVVYPISPAIFPDVTVILVIQRRILYYVLNILFPCFWLNILSVLTFCLPPDAGEKITLSITVLLSYSVFMLLVAESMPPTSEFVPLIGIYLTVSMAVASVSVIMTVFVLKLHHCSPHQKQVPKWVRHYVLGILARVVRCSCLPNMPPFCMMQNIKGQREDSVELDDRDVNNKLLKDIEIITRNHNHQKEGSHSKRSSAVYNTRNSNGNDDYNAGSRLNLDFREASVSNRSSESEAEMLNKRQDKYAASMDEILRYLKVLVAKSDTDDFETDVINEWKQVALVVDRLFFWLFLILTIVSTVVTLVIVPSFKYVAEGGI